MFGLGTIAGMMVITMIVGVLFAYNGKRSGRFNRGLTVASGVINVALGLFMSLQIGFAAVVFASHPS